MCCGNKRVQMRTSSGSSQASRNSRAANTAPQPPVPFVNVGKTELTVIGPVSGKRYHFPKNGARVPIDARDRPMLLRLRQLRQMQ